LRLLTPTEHRRLRHRPSRSRLRASCAAMRARPEPSLELAVDGVPLACGGRGCPEREYRPASRGSRRK